MTWEIPVLDPELDPVAIRVVVARGQVIAMLPGGGALIIPPQSDDAWCEVIRRARESIGQ